MYDKRIKIFAILSAALLLVCLLRLAQMQLLPDSSLQEKIAKLKQQRGRARQLKTVRGVILDRKGNVLAADEARFYLYINYGLSRFLDERVQQARLLRAGQSNDPDKVRTGVQQQIKAKFEQLQRIIDKCIYFGLERADVEERIQNINDRIWNLRTFVAWVRSGPDPNILAKYNHNVNSIPLSEALADFRQKFTDEDDRLLEVGKINDLAKMSESQRLLELKSDDDIFFAQVEFMNVDEVKILAKAHRFYPYGSVAAQTIGWVGRPQERDKQLFAYDRLLSYLDDEVCGREDGVEYICETILRGRRGEEVYDIDRELQSRTDTQFGKDVSLTLDIELQQRIETYLADCKVNRNCRAPTAAVVIEVATGDILALVSMPVYNLNRARYDYGDIAGDPNKPLINRAIYEQYPPGSVVKPLILIAGLESGEITTDEIISCPAQEAPAGWPSCWIYNRNRVGHDGRWENNAHSTIKGSCNIYFSRLADRIDPSVLQRWLYKFGYGHKIPLAPAAIREAGPNRSLRQAQGQISTGIPRTTIRRFEQVPPLEGRERRYFGIGQGNLRATPLQVANAMAAIARSGLYKSPRLFIPSVIASAAKQSLFSDRPDPSASPQDDKTSSDSKSLDISPQTLDVVRDGMSAVVNEVGGTAYKTFAPVLSSFAEQDVKVYGKTGSTEQPDNAWFAGFAEDSSSRSISIAVVVEGGQQGSRDAAPLGRDIIQFCIEAGHIGRRLNIIGGVLESGEAGLKTE